MSAAPATTPAPAPATAHAAPAPAPTLPSPVVSTQWLADHLGSEGLLVLDASVATFTRPDGGTGRVSGHELYLLDGHVPGAVFADLIDDLSDPEGPHPFTRPDAERFAAAAGALGVGPDTAVVVYDSALGQWAARLWWLFRAFGFDRVAVVDGGLTRWKAEQRELELGHITPAPAEFTARERPELWADKAHVAAVVAGESTDLLVCASPAAEFRGEVSPRGRAGHIPGSRSIPVGSLLDRERRTYLDGDGRRDALAPALQADRVVAYCSSGIAATSVALALTIEGREVAVYDGSLSEWAADPEAPLAVTG